MGKPGRPKGYRSPSLYKHFNGKMPEIVSLLAELKIDKRELNRMLRAKPGYMMRIFTNPLGSMRFKHIVSLAVILDKTPGEIADIVFKSIDRSYPYKVKKHIQEAREYAERNRERNRINQENKRNGIDTDESSWDYDID